MDQYENIFVYFASLFTQCLFLENKNKKYAYKMLWNSSLSILHLVYIATTALNNVNECERCYEPTFSSSLQSLILPVFLN